MASLKVTTTTGEVTTHKITPVIEYRFEQQFKGGFHKVFRDQERQEHVYWLAWECLRSSGVTVKPFGEEFLATLTEVEVIGDELPNG